MSTATMRREIVVEEIRETGPISTADVLRRLEDEMPRLAVLRAISDAEDTGEIALGITGRRRAVDPPSA